MLERELFELLEGTADAAFSVDEQGMICSWNSAAEKLFGYSSSEVLHESCAELFQGKGALGTQVCADECEVIECAASRREIPNYDLEVKSRSGRRIWVNVSILVFHDQRTKRRLLVHLTRDVSQRKKTEELTRTVLQAAKQLAILPGETSQPAPVPPLTEQERRVLRLFAEGKSPSKIAWELGIAPRTLRNHIHHVNHKLRTHSRLEAVMHAIRRGLI